MTHNNVPSHQNKDVYTLMFEQRSSALESSPGFMAIGSNAVPYLARALAIDRTIYDKLAWVRKPGFQQLAQKLHFSFTWRKSAREMRRAAAFSLLAFGFEARPALPQLHAELVRPNSDDRKTILHCLSSMGTPVESIPWLVRAFPLTTNESAGVRHDLLHTLGQGGTNAARLASSIVIASLSDKESDVRSVAAQALDHWGQFIPEAIPPLLTLLNCTNEYEAASAAGALSRITNRCEPAISILRRMQPTNDYCRVVIAISLWRLGEDPEEARTTLEGLLTSIRGKAYAARFLGEMGSPARKSVPALLRASQQVVGTWVEPYDQAECAKAVLRIQGESPEAYAVLERSITTESNRWVRETMISEIAQLGSLAEPLLPVLQRALNDPSRDVRNEARMALARLHAHP
jgi:hypothetical protein